MYVRDKFVALVLTGTDLKLNLRLPPTFEKETRHNHLLILFTQYQPRGEEDALGSGLQSLFFVFFFISGYLMFFIFIFCQFKVSDL